MVECPVCLRDIEVGPNAAEGDVFVCPYCKIRLRLVRVGDHWEAERLAEDR